MNMQSQITATTAPTARAARVAQIDWDEVALALNNHGAAMLEKLLNPEECREIAALYPDDGKFRSHIIMARHGFGKGEYKYFAYPLPKLIGGMRDALYPRLAPIANAWNERMGMDMRYPASHRDFLDLCHRAGQEHPTPLLLQYDARRLQRAASGPLRRPGVPVAGGGAADGTGARSSAAANSC